MSLKNFLMGLKKILVIIKILGIFYIIQITISGFLYDILLMKTFSYCFYNIFVQPIIYYFILYTVMFIEVAVYKIQISQLYRLNLPR